jgi:hypothetical protein
MTALGYFSLHKLQHQKSSGTDYHVLRYGKHFISYTKLLYGLRRSPLYWFQAFIKFEPFKFNTTSAYLSQSHLTTMNHYQEVLDGLHRPASTPNLDLLAEQRSLPSPVLFAAPTGVGCVAAFNFLWPNSACIIQAPRGIHGASCEFLLAMYNHQSHNFLTRPTSNFKSFSPHDGIRVERNENDPRPRIRQWGGRERC